MHHASEDLEWISAWRFHPFNLMFGTVLVDVAFILAGISTDIFLVVGPFNILTSAMVHANLNWTFGPLKYVIASPVFHRWHHTAPEEGGMKNYAGTFSLWDRLFGTFYMPEGVLPEKIRHRRSAIPEGNGAAVPLSDPALEAARYLPAALQAHVDALLHLAVDGVEHGGGIAWHRGCVALAAAQA